MTRSEQIKAAAKNTWRYGNDVLFQAFKEGAEWADSTRSDIYSHDECQLKFDKLEARLKIAVEALNKIYGKNHECLCECAWDSKDALAKIEELGK